MARKYFLHSFFYIVLSVLCNPCLAQKKYEREYSIKPNAVPERALGFVSSVFKNAKVHWYREESLTGKSIEAKLKDSGKRYSIEFDETGRIQDVELLSKASQISPKGRVTLWENLKKEFSKYKIVKTQLHWNGSESDLKQALLTSTVSPGIVNRYELVLRATRGTKTGYFEILCETNGAIVNISEIVQRNADNLIY